MEKGLSYWLYGHFKQHCRRGKIFSAAHDFCTVRFTSWHGGTRLRKSRVFAPRGKGFEEYQTGSCGMDAAAETETGGVALTSPGAERQGDVWFTV